MRTERIAKERMLRKARRAEQRRERGERMAEMNAASQEQKEFRRDWFRYLSYAQG